MNEDVYLPEDVLASARPELEATNAAAQARFLAKAPTLSGAEVAERAGHTAANKSATVSRWKATRAIFSVRHGGRDLFPAFQFGDSGEPRPVIAEALKALPATMSEWQTALWFFGANSWLRGHKPMDRLDDRKAIMAAARAAGETWVG